MDLAKANDCSPNGPPFPILPLPDNTRICTYGRIIFLEVK